MFFLSAKRRDEARAEKHGQVYYVVGLSAKHKNKKTAHHEWECLGMCIWTDDTAKFTNTVHSSALPLHRLSCLRQQGSYAQSLASQPWRTIP